MNTLNKNKTGLTVGLFYLLCHAGWLLMVAVGIAKPLLDWVLSLHFFTLTYSIDPFRVMPAFLLLVVAFVSGYSMGWVFAALWNLFHARQAA